MHTHTHTETYTHFLGNMNIKVAFVSCQTMRIMHEQKFHYRPLSLILYIPPSLSILCTPRRARLCTRCAFECQLFLLAPKVLCVCVFCATVQLSPPSYLQAFLDPNTLLQSVHAAE